MTLPHFCRAFIATALVAISFSTTLQAAPPVGYELDYAEEFDGNGLDLNKWAYRADAKHRSIQRAENISIASGVLRLNLTPLDEPIQGKSNAGAGIVTTRRFHYGYYEVRARMGDGIDHDNDGEVDEGWHHAFWAMYADPDPNATPAGSITTTFPDERRTEIDCYENADGDGYNEFTQHIIIWKPNGKSYGRRPDPPSDHVKPREIVDANFNVNDWNTYAFEWTAAGVQFFVNSQKTVFGAYPFDDPNFEHDDINVWLTAISANWCDQDPELSMAEYDYFRYYAPINQARGRQVTVTSTFHPDNGWEKAVDGVVSDASSWVGEASPTGNVLEVELADPIELSQAHIYSGNTAIAGSGIDSYQLEGFVAGAWQPISGSIEGGTDEFLSVFNFDVPITVERVRLMINDTGVCYVREIALWQSPTSAYAGLIQENDPLRLPQVAGIYDFEGSGTEFTAKNVASGIVMSDLSVGGLTGASVLNQGASLTGMNSGNYLQLAGDSGTLGGSADAMSANRYLSFTVTNNSGYSVDLTGLRAIVGGDNISSYFSARVFTDVQGFNNVIADTIGVVGENGSNSGFDFAATDYSVDFATPSGSNIVHPDDFTLYDGTSITFYLPFIQSTSDSSRVGEVDNIQLEFTPTVDTAPGSPTGLTGTGEVGRVSLDWTDNNEGDLASYSVYRSIGSGEGFSQIASGLISSDYFDSSVSNETTYYYVVSATDENGNESGFSSEIAAKPTVFTPVALINPGFEQPDSGLISDGFDGASDVPGWNGGVVAASGVESTLPNSGLYRAYLTGGEGAVWQTTSHTIASGDSYALEFFYIDRSDSSEVTASLVAWDGGIETVLASTVIAASGVWEFGTMDVRVPDTSTDGQQLRVKFENTAGGGTSLGIDDVSLGLVHSGSWAGFVVDNGLSGALIGNQDGDPLVDFLEYAFGTNPTLNDTGGLTVDGIGGNFTAGIPVLDMESSPSDFIARFVRLVDHDEQEVAYTVQFTHDLIGWEDWDGSLAVRIPGTAEINGYEVVEMSYPTTLSNGEIPYFFRVKVEDFVDTAPQVSSFSYSDEPITIPSSGAPTVTSVISVNGTRGSITDVNVNVNITHTYVADLVLLLIHPDGTRITLSNRHGGSGNDYTNTVFDDEASSPVSSESPPFTGEFQPTTILSELNGKTADGDWTLEVDDRADADGGTIDSWSIELTTE